MANLLLGIPYLKLWEGGLSNKTSDTASKSPSPYQHKGVYGWHTNKGVTWETFKSASKIFGFAVNPLNFLSMPDAIWVLIFTKMYAEPMQAHNCKSDAIGVALADFLWASGGAKQQISKWLKSKYKVTIYNGKNFDMKIAVNFINTLDEKTAFLEIINVRRAYFKSLNQPKNIAGWLNRMNALEKFGLNLIKKKAKTKAKFSNSNTRGFSWFGFRFF